jgi:hypothetical protein
MLECVSCYRRLYIPSTFLFTEGEENCMLFSFSVLCLWMIDVHWSLKTVWKRFVEALSTTHTEICPWRTISSPTHFATLSIDQNKLIDSFTQRIRSFAGVFPLPRIANSFLQSLVSVFLFLFLFHFFGYVFVSLQIFSSFFRFILCFLYFRANLLVLK